MPHTKNVSISPGAGHFNLTCYGFHVWAEDFLTAEKMYVSAARSGSFVPHFLCCQSVELSLKAFLSLKGMTREQLRKKFGHNLAKLFDEACRQGIHHVVTIEGNDAVIVKLATAWYDSTGGKRFQYFDVSDAMRAFKNAPDLAGLESLATRLQSSTLRDAVLKG